MADHLRSDLDLVKLLAGVDTDDAADHLGDDNHVSEVSLDEVGLLVGLGVLLGLAQLLDQAHGLPLQTPVDSAAGTGVDDISELLGVKVQKAIYRWCETRLVSRFWFPTKFQIPDFRFQIPAHDGHGSVCLSVSRD